MGNSTDVEMMGRLYDLLAQKEMALKDKEMALLQKDLALLEKEKEISVLQKEREMALLEREHANDEVLKLQEEKLESQTWPFVSWRGPLSATGQGVAYRQHYVRECE